ncbi:OstA-like protein [Aestuariibaculum sp. YM273]|uniref:OstA-like protein n=1 Tax=Aestuariibaculum sp. YM273 TaxID=3070659 RepID=UPI0027DE765B|nr:OstA-like protein [Aestuariibaculum sp. YM273]WMI65748.1 OstA-like protein [Aestuariibaculum sp. YM273]
MKTSTPIYLLLVLCLFIIDNSSAQDKRQIDIKYSGRLNRDEANYPGATILTRDDSQQVHLYHNGTDLWCDKAIRYGKENFIEAYGNVKMIQGDTINMSAKYIEYSGISELAFASGDVVLKDPNSTISSDTLYFDRINQEAFYKSGGTVVKDTSGTITSKIGRYLMQQKKYRFTDDVVLTSDDAVINSNYFDFYSDTGKAYLYGPSTIVTETSKTYCEKGFYDTKNKTGYAVKESRIDYDNRIIEGDSLYFDNNISFASATNNIKVTDTINKTIVKGHYAEVFKEKDSIFITKRALAITKQENDSIYMHADKIMVTGKPDERILRAYYNAKIFKTDLSGKADSIHSNQKTGLTQLINLNRLSSSDKFSTSKKPIMWNAESQMTGDTIHLFSNTKTEKLDSLLVFNNAFIISKDTLTDDGYNQINGLKLLGLFDRENQLRHVDITKNAQSIFYVRNDKQELVGIDKAKSGSISILFGNGDIEEYTRFNQVDGTLPPESKYLDKDKRLKGFDWREEERPTSVADLFKEDEPLVLPKIQGLEDYIPEDDFFNDEMMERIDNALEKSYSNIPFTKITLKGGEPFNFDEISKTKFNIVKTAGIPNSVVMGIYVEFNYEELKDLDKAFILDLQKGISSDNLNQIKILKGLTDWNPINFPISLTYKEGKSVINLYESIMTSSQKNIDYYSRVNSLQLFIGYFNGFNLDSSTNTILDYTIKMYLKKSSEGSNKIPKNIGSTINK